MDTITALVLPANASGANEIVHSLAGYCSLYQTLVTMITTVLMEIMIDKNIVVYALY